MLKFIPPSPYKKDYVPIQSLALNDPLGMSETRNQSFARDRGMCNKFILNICSKYCWEYSKEQENAFSSFSLKVKEGFLEMRPSELFTFHMNHKACP